MSEKEKQVLESLLNKIKNLPDKQKSYVAGLADGMALMADAKKPDSEERSSTDDA